MGGLAKFHLLQLVGNFDQLFNSLDHRETLSSHEGNHRRVSTVVFRVAQHSLCNFYLPVWQQHRSATSLQCMNCSVLTCRAWSFSRARSHSGWSWWWCRWRHRTQTAHSWCPWHKWSGCRSPWCPFVYLSLQTGTGYKLQPPRMIAHLQ